MELMRPEFDYFSKQPLQNSIDSAGKVLFTPISALHHGAPVEFLISGLDQKYLDLSRSEIELTVKIQDAADANPAAHSVSTINYPLHSLFSNVEVILANSTVSDANGLYPHRAYIETLFDKDPASQKSELQMELWYKDTAGQFQTFDCAANGANTGLVKRAAYFEQGAEVQMMGRLHVDLFQQALALPSKLPMRLRFTRTSDAFILVTEAPGQANQQVAYKMVILDFNLWIHKIDASSSLAVAHEKMMLTKNIVIPYKRVKMHNFTIPQGYLQSMQENLYNGPIPRRIILVMVRNARMQGGYQQNPFFYEHFDLNFLSLQVNGTPNPHKPYSPEFNRNKYIRSYNSLFEALGVKNADKTISITRADYANGYTAWAFDLTKDLNSGESICARREGNVRLELKFRVATPEAINVILYGVFDSILEIDRHRNIVTDF